MTERTDHAAEARRVLGNFPHEDLMSNTDALAWAQVHATLALVEQQRIANLVAIYGATAEVEDGYKSVGVDYGHLSAEIREALGLS